MISTTHHSHSAHLTGVVLVIISAVVFSSAGIFTKGVEANAWDVIFWRGVFAALFTTSYITWRGSLRNDFLNMGYPGLAAAVIGASGTAAFLSSFKLTTVANVALLFASAPLLAIAFAWLWFRERPTKASLIACFAAMIGVAIIVSASIGAPSLKGDLLALWMTIAMAFFFVIYRRYPDTPAGGPNVLSCIILTVPCLLLSNPFQVPFNELVILAAFGLVFAIASVTLTEGAKRIPAGETALLSILETPLAPVLAWIILAELPTSATLIGGFIILIAVIGSQLPNLKSNRKGF